MFGVSASAVAPVISAQEAPLTTPPPVYTVSGDLTSSPGDRPATMDHHEKARFRAAAFRLTRLYPGVAGEVLSRELLAWEELGYRLDADGAMHRLVEHAMSSPLPGDPEPAPKPRVTVRTAVGINRPA